MPILDSSGRDATLVWRSKALFTFLRSDPVRKVCITTGIDPQRAWSILADYLKPGNEPQDGQEDKVRKVLHEVLESRVRRRVLASQIVKAHGVGKAEAMRWLGKVAAE